MEDWLIERVEDVLERDDLEDPDVMLSYYEWF